MGADMEAIVGIICEYDPFHRGHRRQFDLIRAQLPAARIVCLMSGPFTQRGMPALHAPADRARAALEAGCDLVLELPCAFAVRDAEHFALGGVSALTRLGFVTHLSFGAEDGLDALMPAAALLDAPTPAFQEALRGALARGASFAAAQGEALGACLGGLGKAPWEKPNNILALCYLRALRRLESPLLPLPVRREGDYHASALEGQRWPSATAVRAAFLGGDLAAARAACGYDLPAAPVCRPDALDAVLLYKLRTQSAQALARLPDCTEGLEKPPQGLRGPCRNAGGAALPAQNPEVRPCAPEPPVLPCAAGCDRRPSGRTSAAHLCAPAGPQARGAERGAAPQRPAPARPRRRPAPG